MKPTTCPQPTHCLLLPAGTRLVRALYGQAQDLPASLYDLGLSPYITASILVGMLMVPQLAQGIPLQALQRMQEAKKEGKSVSGAEGEGGGGGLGGGRV